MIKKIKNILGLTILEAMVSTAIVGIGFIAVFQMVNFSVRSIDNSGERTKANYLVSMMAEDVIGYRHTVHGLSADKNVVIDIDGTVTVDGVATPDAKKFVDHLIEQEFMVGSCGGSAVAVVDADPDADTGGTGVTSIYDSEFNDAPSNKEEKWMRIISDNRYLKCKGDDDIKRMKMYKICKWTSVCPGYVNAQVTDDGLYIGRIQVNLNNGRKRKFLYFQADYKIRK